MSDDRPWDFWIDVRHDEKAGVSVAYFANWTDSPTGVAKCMPEDEFDAELGAQFAVGRLLAKMGKQLERDAYDEVYARDAEREVREASAKEALERKRVRAHDFQCQFAALIKAVQEEEKIATEQDIQPAPVPTKTLHSTGSVLRSNQEALNRGRADLPA